MTEYEIAMGHANRKHAEACELANLRSRSAALEKALREVRAMLVIHPSANSGGDYYGSPYDIQRYIDSVLEDKTNV